MEWSDIRIFLQVARNGTMVAAAAPLRMDHATISRKISRLEQDAGVRLFDRAGRRLSLTEAGHKLVSAAERLETIVIRDVMGLSSNRQGICGTVRIGTTEDFGAYYLAPRVHCLTAGHESLEIELVALPKAFSLASHEVDILITLDRPMTGDIRYRKLVDLEFGLFASDGHFVGKSPPQSLDDLIGENWCGYIPELLSTPELDFFGRSHLIAPKYRTTSTTAQLGAVLGGSAIAALPCFIASSYSSLQRILPETCSFTRSYWMAVHEDLAQHERVRAVMRAIETLVAQDRMLFVPDTAGGPYAERGDRACRHFMVGASPALPTQRRPGLPDRPNWQGQAS